MDIIGVGIAHRFQALNESIAHYLANRPRLRVVGTAQNSRSLLELVETQKPQLVLLDPFPGDREGLDLVHGLLKLDRNLGIVVMMMDPQYAYAYRLLRAGVRGLLSAECSLAVLEKTLIAVHQGKSRVPPNFSQKMVEALGTDAAALEQKLTEREHQVMQMIGRGLSKGEISQQLYISTKTVDSHRANMLRKLGLRNNMEVVHYALRNGILPL